MIINLNFGYNKNEAKMHYKKRIFTVFINSIWIAGKIFHVYTLILWEIFPLIKASYQ